jgi:hypothetical protein
MASPIPTRGTSRYQAIPAGLGEGFVGVWLIAKGFSRSATVFPRPTPGPSLPLVTSAPLASSAR